MYQTQLWPGHLDELLHHFIRNSNRKHTTEKHVVRLGEVGDLVGTAERELALRRLRSIPLHTVSGGDLAEHGVVVKDGGVSGIAELAVVGGGTEVELASSFCDRLQLSRGRARRTRGSGTRLTGWRDG